MVITIRFRDEIIDQEANRRCVPEEVGAESIVRSDGSRGPLEGVLRRWLDPGVDSMPPEIVRRSESLRYRQPGGPSSLRSPAGAWLGAEYRPTIFLQRKCLRWRARRRPWPQIMPTLCPPGPKPARKTMIKIGKNPIELAEREGFEPSVPVTQYARLAIWCLRPLGHLSALPEPLLNHHRQR